MAEFTDAKGRKWQVNLSLGLASRVREATGVNVLLAVKQQGKSVEWAGHELFWDPEKFVTALWLFVAEQAEKANVSRADFEDGIDLAVYRKAVEAVTDTCVGFSHLPGAFRQAMGTGEQVLRRMETAAMTHATNSTGSGGGTSSAGG